MTVCRPARYVSNKDALILLTVMFVGCGQLAQGSHAMLLATRSWFQRRQSLVQSRRSLLLTIISTLAAVKSAIIVPVTYAVAAVNNHQH